MIYTEFEKRMKFDAIDPVQAVRAVAQTLGRIDSRLMVHGERVAYIASCLHEAGGFPLDRRILFLLSVFHDIGAYETKEVDQMLDMEATHVQRHAIFGYLFLKGMTPLSPWAEAILYHHFSTARLETVNTACGDYAAMIHLADRIDIALTMTQDAESLIAMLEKYRPVFKADYLDAAEKCLRDGLLLPALRDGSYREENLRLSAELVHSAQEAFDYLNMIVYSIDFRSEHTVTHTVNTVSIALYIAHYFCLDDAEMERIYLGALLHDIGKITIPHAILESTGRLTDEEMAVMRTHVTETAVLIEGVVPDDICQIAIRHHEKLDGSGYPRGLTGDVLTFPQRIVAVADIISALSSRRSYKEPFPKERSLAILADMMQTKLDPQICQCVLDNYDVMMAETDISRRRVIDQYTAMRAEYERMVQSAN